MSIPGGSSPYQQPGPGGTPQPAPNNPYAQPRTPGGYGPMVPAAAPHPASAPAPAPVGSPSRRRGGMPSWLWAVLGVAAASAVWGAVLVATDSGSGSDGGDQPAQPDRPRPNLAGYAYHADMCAAADTSAFDVDYEQPVGYMDPSLLAYEHEAVDRSSCTFYLAPTAGDGYSYLYLTYDAVWHKGSDPREEFAPLYSSQEQYADVNYDYRVEPADGLGDEAYLTFQRTTQDDRLARVVLGVRDGWFEYSLTWDAYIDASTDPSLAQLSDEDYVAQAMRDSAQATLASLHDDQPAGEVDGDPDA